MSELPPDPVGPMTSQAIGWKHVMDEYEAAGFTHEEAFELTAGQAREYWSVVYDDHSPAQGPR